jgi:MFS transporter, DHA2 family, methylenomycin A resistance protein
MWLELDLDPAQRLRRFGRGRLVEVTEEARRRQRLTLWAMSVSQGMILLDITIVNIALPSIQSQLHMSTALLEWVISAYALTLATLIPLGGTLGDRYGRKRLFLVGLVIFTAASAACALSSVDVALIGFRVLQGIGGAVMSALTLSILSEAYPPETRPGAIGVWAAVAGLGFGLGPVIGGVLIGLFNWSSVFWVNVPIGIVGFVVAIVGVSESRDPAARHLDPTGIVLSAAGLFGVTFGFIEAANHAFASPVVYGPILAGAALLAVFVWWEHRCASPMAPPALLRDRGFRTSCSVYFLAYLALASVMFFVTLLFQDVKGWSALHTGLSWLLMNGPFIVMAQLSGRVQRRFSSGRVVVAGCLVAAGGVFILSFITTSTPFVLLGAGYVLLGAGYGTLVPGITGVAMRTVPVGSSGVAAGILNTSRQVGTSVGLGFVGFLGVRAASATWASSIAQLPGSSQRAASGLTQSVTSGDVAAVTAKLGRHAGQAATSAFVHGYSVALTVCALALLVATVVTYAGLLRSLKVVAAGDVSPATS